MRHGLAINRLGSGERRSCHTVEFQGHAGDQQACENRNRHRDQDTKRRSEHDGLLTNSDCRGSEGRGEWSPRLRISGLPVNPCRPLRTECPYRLLQSTGSFPVLSSRHREQPYVVVSDGIRICIRCDTSSATHKYQQFQTPLPSDCYYAQRLCLSSMAQSLRDVKS